MRRRFTREQKMTIVYGILCIVLILVILQLWLLTATMNAYLGKNILDESIDAKGKALMDLSSILLPFFGLNQSCRATWLEGLADNRG